MSIAANIVLADALATPVNHTFIPQSKDADGMVWWEDQSFTNQIGYWRIGASLVRPSNPSAGVSSRDRENKVRLVLMEPVLETVANNSAGITPPPTVAYIPRATATLTISERSVPQQRKDLRKMFSNLFNDPQVVGMIENLIVVNT